MANETKLTTGDHLDVALINIKRYILAELLTLTNAISFELDNISNSVVLNTVPATVDGGMWYELDSGVPRYVKLKHGDHTFSLPTSIVNISPSLTVTPAATTVPVDGSITAAVSFNGNGNITVTSDTINPTYNASTKTITVPYSYDVASATITVALSAGYGYLADTATFNVTMAKASPNLSVTPSANTTNGDDITASVSYSGGGTLSVSSDNANVTPTYADGTVTVPYYAFTDADTTVTITVSVAANGNYNAQSSTFSVLYEKCEAVLDPQLTLIGAPNDYDRTYHGIDFVADGSTVSVSYLGDGTITVTSDWLASGESVTYDASTNKINLDFNKGSGAHLITVSLSMSPPYTAATTSFEARALDYYEPT